MRLWRGGASVVAGIDEVGRGAIAGPLVTAAVVLPPPPARPPSWLSELRDSKALTPRARERLAALIRAEAAAWSVAWAPAARIDEIGLAAALRTAQREALAALPQPPDAVLADGNDDLRLPWPTEMIVRGDAQVSSIAAASIVAKVARDGWMRELAERIDGYGFARHKGYATAAHLSALRERGACAEHRRSCAPVAAVTTEAQGRFTLAAGS